VFEALLPRLICYTSLDILIACISFVNATKHNAASFSPRRLLSHRSLGNHITFAVVSQCFEVGLAIPITPLRRKTDSLQKHFLPAPVKHTAFWLIQCYSGMPATPRMDMVDAPTGVRHSRMYHPLVDIDVNTRLLGPKPSSLPSPSKTRSPTPSPSPHSESRRLPSGVNPSESPRYTAPSNSPTLAMLPAHRSKIPRKAHSSAAIATPERTQAQALGPKASFIAGVSTIPVSCTHFISQR